MILQLGGWARNEDRVFEGEDPDALRDFQDPLIRLQSPIRYRLTAHLAAGELLVRGEVSVAVSARCGRCGEWRDAVFRAPDFLRSIPVRTLNDVINLTEDIREDTLLAFPANFVCSASCQGVCPECGANRNQAACSCSLKNGHAGWRALDTWQPAQPSGRAGA
jgi:uncharacterized protein